MENNKQNQFNPFPLWEQMNKKAKRKSKKQGEKDRRPSSLAPYSGIHTCPNGVKIEFTDSNRI